jgi:hypothetical protein
MQQLITRHSLASDGEVPFTLKRWQSEGRIAGPRVFPAGQLIVGRGGHGTEGFGLTTAPTYPQAPIREASGPMAKNGIASVPALVPYRYINRLSGGGYFGSTSRRFTLTEDSIFEMLKKMKKRGVKMGIGTDLVVDWIKYMPFACIDELKSFVAVGYTSSEVLVAATKTSAEILRMADRLGTLEVGKLADIIVVVDGKPE